MKAHAWKAPRTQNDRTAFRLLLEHGPLSRSRCCSCPGWSKPTAGQMITRLERIGLIAPRRRGYGCPRPERGELRRATRR